MERERAEARSEPEVRAPGAPAGPSTAAAAILHLQRVAGNAAVSGVVGATPRRQWLQREPQPGGATRPVIVDPWADEAPATAPTTVPTPGTGTTAPAGPSAPAGSAPAGTTAPAGSAALPGPAAPGPASSGGTATTGTPTPTTTTPAGTTTPGPTNSGAPPPPAAAPPAGGAAAIALPNLVTDTRATLDAVAAGDWGGPPSAGAIATFVTAITTVKAAAFAEASARRATEQARRAARRAARRGRTGAAARTAADQAAAAVQPAVPATFQPALAAQISTDLAARWRSAISGRLGRSPANRRFSTFATRWCAEERERVLFQTTGLATNMRGTYSQYSRYLRPSAEQLAGLGALEPIDAGAHGDGTPVAPYTNRFLRALAARAPAVAYRANNYQGHGAGAWLNSGLCLDLYLTGDDAARDARGFWDSERVMVLLRAVQATCRALGGDWQGCYDDFAVATAVRREMGGTKVVYVNDARNNNHGPLLLHVHVDLLPPAVAATPPSPAAAGAAEAGR